MQAALTRRQRLIEAAARRTLQQALDARKVDKRIGRAPPPVVHAPRSIARRPIAPAGTTSIDQVRPSAVARVSPEPSRRPSTAPPAALRALSRSANRSPTTHTRKGRPASGPSTPTVNVSQAGYRGEGMTERIRNTGDELILDDQHTLLRVTGPTRLLGAAHGGVHVLAGGSLIVAGIIRQRLVVDTGGELHASGYIRAVPKVAEGASST